MRTLVFFILWMGVGMFAWYLHRRLDGRRDLTVGAVRTRRVVLCLATVAGLMLVAEMS